MSKVKSEKALRTKRSKCLVYKKGDFSKLKVVPTTGVALHSKQKYPKKIKVYNKTYV